MRIPLDYYRILGLPLAASEDQLRQAYSDRRQQMPRREYSHTAITSRKQLIEEAYVVLSDPKERKAYDGLYLSHAYASEYGQDGMVVVEDRIENGIEGGHVGDRRALSIEINSSELAGALLILQELGEYEQILELGRPYLLNRYQNHRQSGSELDTEPSDFPDIVLTVALACLELGREQWQQGQYENAAISLETGEEVLMRENVFVNVQSEIRADLYRLRPYRILELLALPEENTSARQQGLNLLGEILEQRGGVDGQGEDYSGLNVDDFLRFIQQIRNYLTVAEQHKIFEAESKRPSAVATYLAVYALIARGFTQRQPALIRQAKQMLLTLGKRQDVHLEQSLCALLLGQTEQASRALELSQEYEALAFIRENSQNSPDLLPGLCLYAERWLQNDVLAHFRDLANQSPSLKEYFANTQVQSYLEALPNDSEIQSESVTSGSTQPRANNHKSYQPGYQKNGQNGQNGHNAQARPAPADSRSYRQPELTQLNANGYESYRGSSNFTSGSNQYYENQQTPSYVTGNTGFRSSDRPTGNTSQSSTRRRKPLSTGGYGATSVIDSPRPTRVKTRRRVTKRTSLLAKTKLLWMLLGSVAGLVMLWVLLSTTFGWLKSLLTPAPALQGEQLAISLNQAPVDLPKADSQPQYPQGKLTEASATDVIQAWLTSKSAALGPNHDAETLKNILTSSALRFWYNKALSDKNANRYRKLEHQLIRIDRLEASDDDLDRAVVDATVKETAEFYENDQPQRSQSYSDTVKIRYTLIRQEGKWLVREMALLGKVNGS